MSRKKKLLLYFSLSVFLLLIILLFCFFRHTGENRPNSGKAPSADQSRYVYSNIKSEDNYAKQCRAIDRKLQKKAKSRRYTIDDPYILLNPYGNSPLTAYVVFYTEKPVAVTITVKGTTASTDIVRTASGFTRYHTVPVAGLYAGKKNQVLLTLTDRNKNTTAAKELTIRTDELPQALCDTITVEYSSQAPSNELTVISGFHTQYPLAFDAQGEIRWYLYGSYDTYGVFPLANGHFLLNDGLVCTQNLLKPLSQRIMEMDYMGKVYRIYRMDRGVHHDMTEKTPNGNLLVLTNSLDEHVEDMVAELDRKTGEIVKTLDLSEIFKDTYRDRTDWAHLNTISYNEETDSVLISVRNLNCVIKVNWTTMELVWILGDPVTFRDTPYADKVLTATGEPFRYQYQQHASYEIAEDLDGDPDTLQLLLYDNHYINARAMETFDNDPYSYVSIYTVNEKKHTVSLFRSYPVEKSIVYSNALLKTDENRVYSMGGNRQFYSIDNTAQGMICELDYTSGELINRYLSRTTFYRGYELLLEPDTCTTLTDAGQEDVVGEPCRFTKKETTASLPETILPKKLFTFHQIDDDTLCVWGKNHTIEAVELVGSDTAYRYVPYGTGQKQNLFATKEFYTAIDFSDVAYGSYEVVIQYKGTRYRTEKTLLITAEEMLELNEN